MLFHDDETASTCYHTTKNNSYFLNIRKCPNFVVKTAF